MGQREIMKILKNLKENEWIESVEIAKKLKQNSSLITNSLKKLLMNGEVLRRDYCRNYIRGYEWSFK